MRKKIWTPNYTLRKQFGQNRNLRVTKNHLFCIKQTYPVDDVHDSPVFTMHTANGCNPALVGYPAHSVAVSYCYPDLDSA